MGEEGEGYFRHLITEKNLVAPVLCWAQEKLLG